MRGRIKELLFDSELKNALILIETSQKNTAFECYNKYKGEKILNFEIKKVGRSKDANAYAWVLISDLANKLNISKEEVYRQAIKEIGGNSEIVCVKKESAEKLCSSWSHNGLGWITDTFPSKIDNCINVILYYGSSIYDSGQMSAFIKFLVSECKIQGIETMTPREIEALNERWGK